MRFPRLRHWLDDVLQPPQVVPIKRTWADYFKDAAGHGIVTAIAWMLELVLMFLKRSKSK